MPTNKTTVVRVNWGFILASTVVACLVSAFLCSLMVEVTPCHTESDTWCHWNAVTQGNGEGTSFTTYWEGFTVTR